MALALLRLQDVYNLPAHQVLTSLDQMNHLLTNQVAEGDVGSGNVGLSFTSVLCMTMARWMFFGICFEEYLGKDKKDYFCMLAILNLTLCQGGCIQPPVSCLALLGSPGKTSLALTR